MKSSKALGCALEAAARISVFAQAELAFSRSDAHVIRNAGGRASEAVRSLCISQQLLGTNQIYVIHHTGTERLCDSCLLPD